MNGNARESEVADNATPFHFGMTKVEEQSQMKSGGFQIVTALCQVLVGKLLDTFDFHQQTVVHYQICRIRADGLALVGNREGGLGSCPNPTKAGGAERQVLPWVLNKNFVPVEDGIYYIGPPGTDRKYPLEFFQFSSNTSRLLTRIDGYVWDGLSVSPDRKTILFVKSLTSGSNLMMIENFH